MNFENTNDSNSISNWIQLNRVLTFIKDDVFSTKVNLIDYYSTDFLIYLKEHGYPIMPRDEYYRNENTIFEVFSYTSKYIKIRSSSNRNIYRVTPNMLGIPLQVGSYVPYYQNGIGKTCQVLTDGLGYYLADEESIISNYFEKLDYIQIEKSLPDGYTVEI